MANRIWDNLEVSIGTEQVPALLAACKGDDLLLDFNRIIPMPETMGIQNSDITEKAVAYVLGEEAHPAYEPSEKDVETAKRMRSKYADGPADERRMLDGGAPITKGDFDFLGRTACANLRLYGARDWYYWCIANWGTKWNADDPFVRPVREEEGITTLMFEFSTANHAPLPVIKRLSEMFLDAEFKLTYRNENPFEGTHTVCYKGGEKLESEQPNP